MAQVKSILLVGVGGQGTILVSKILTAGLLKAGYDVKMSEIHGMAQRGGSVSTTIRYGEKVYSPVIGLGEADVLISFEKMEAVRWAPYLKPEGIAVINDYEIAPLPVAIGKAEYPQNTIEGLFRYPGAARCGAGRKGRQSPHHECGAAGGADPGLWPHRGGLGSGAAGEHPGENAGSQPESFAPGHGNRALIKRSKGSRCFLSFLQGREQSFPALPFSLGMCAEIQGKK